MSDEDRDEIRKHVMAIMDLSDPGHPGVLAAIILGVLGFTHRTIQQGWWSSIILLAQKYRYEGYDARNQAAVVMCRNLNEWLREKGYDRGLPYL